MEIISYGLEYGSEFFYNINDIKKTILRVKKDEIEEGIVFDSKIEHNALFDRNKEKILRLYDYEAKVSSYVTKGNGDISATYKLAETLARLGFSVVDINFTFDKGEPDSSQQNFIDGYFNNKNRTYADIVGKKVSSEKHLKIDIAIIIDTEENTISISELDLKCDFNQLCIGFANKVGHIGIFFDEYLFSYADDEKYINNKKIELLEKYAPDLPNKEQVNIYLSYTSNGYYEDNPVKSCMELAKRISGVSVIFCPSCCKLEKNANQYILGDKDLKEFESLGNKVIQERLPYNEMKDVILCSNKFIYCTGDQSFSEVISAKKIPIYEKIVKGSGFGYYMKEYGFDENIQYLFEGKLLREKNLWQESVNKAIKITDEQYRKYRDFVSGFLFREFDINKNIKGIIANHTLIKNYLTFYDKVIDQLIEIRDRGMRCIYHFDEDIKNRAFVRKFIDIDKQFIILKSFANFKQKSLEEIREGEVYTKSDGYIIVNERSMEETIPAFEKSDIYTLYDFISDMFSKYELGELIPITDYSDATLLKYVALEKYDKVFIPIKEGLLESNGIIDNVMKLDENSIRSKLQLYIRS